MLRGASLVAVTVFAAAPALGRPATAELPAAFAAARSALVTGPDEPIFTAPSAEARRRGAAILGARLPVFRAQRAPGCSGAWLMVGAVAWICSDRLEPSPWPPLAATAPSPPGADGLPYRYHFVGELGSFAYRELESAELGTPEAQLEPGFAVALVRVQARAPGDEFGLTTKGLWLPMRDLGPARPLPFHGEALEGDLNLGWIYTTTARSSATPGGPRRGEERAQFTAVPILERAARFGERWYRVGEGAWLSERDLRVATRPEQMPAVAPNERWLDVDRGQQVLTAYVGDRAVFATLISTGRGREGTEQSTPAGDHRLWIKLRSTDMDNLESTEADHLYAIQDVPWVMFFERGYGLHGTFWHRGFGRVRSHGCVNLTPLDAWHLFHWTQPRLPVGWSAVLPTPYDRGTLVHVR